MKKINAIAVVWLRLALAAGFLSAVLSRLGLLGQHSSGWQNFINYTAQVNSFLPVNMAPAIATASTVAETVLGLLLLAGFRTRNAAAAASLLTLVFALAMANSFGIKEPLDYSVFAFSAGAWLLAGMPYYPFSIDQLISRQKNNMKAESNNQLVRGNQSPWLPLQEAGVDTSGIFVKPLRFDNATKRSPVFLLKFEPGASYPNHSHPAGEEVYVLEGEIRFGPDQLHAGDYLYTSPGATHAAYSKTGCTMLFAVPEEVEIL